MKKNNIAIYDDDQCFAQLLQNKIKQHYDNEYTLTLYSSSLKLLDDIYKYDVLFVGYNMPDKNGLIIFHLIQDLPIIKIIVSHYDSIIFDCHEFNLFWFVRKAYLDEELVKLLPNLHNKLSNHNNKFIIRLSHQLLSLYMKDILYIETYKNYLFIYTPYDYYKIRTPFKDILPQFINTSFVIPNYGVLVNLSYISYVDTNKSILELRNGKIFNISRKNKKDIRNIYTEYLEKHDNSYF